jgi:hypothetical protein
MLRFSLAPATPAPETAPALTCCNYEDYSWPLDKHVYVRRCGDRLDIMTRKRPPAEHWRSCYICDGHTPVGLQCALTCGASLIVNAICTCCVLVGAERDRLCLEPHRWIFMRQRRFLEPSSARDELPGPESSIPSCHSFVRVRHKISRARVYILPYSYAYVHAIEDKQQLRGPVVCTFCLHACLSPKLIMQWLA